ncbi:uncharacterized protein SCHCODRAFT_02693688 [Schizophyllum commune H4-8]|nr:uncharacterized protein SCHCODRAFT_02693688 [Schizophyllum commune H4-8]KAI5886195.1 hypothetical protein SCHCODRAFT_02693688 [Schizophyllum commune H4-8]
MQSLRKAWQAVWRRITRSRKASACTRVASVYELMEQIVRTVHHDQGNGGLLSLLVASRFVSQVTLDVLWETQTELVPLFLTLRPCVYVKNYNTIHLSDKSVNKHSDGFIREDVWNRFQSYAQRVKILDIPSLPKAPLRLHASVLKALAYRGTLLRNLHTVRVPGLKSLPLDDNLHLLFSFDRSRQKSYASFYIQDPRSGKLTYLNNLCKLSGVREICAPDTGLLPPLVAFRGLPNLERLQLAHIDPLPPPADAFGYRSLRVLRVDSQGLCDAARTVSALSSEALELHRLVITWTSSPVEPAYVAATSSGKHTAALTLYSTIRRCCMASSLRDIRVPTHSDGRALAASKLFADLLSFPHIEHAEVVFMHPAADIDGAIDCMSAAWPRLQRLSLTHMRRTITSARSTVKLATLRGLLPLERRCPNLSHLRIDIDPASSFPASASAPEDMSTRMQRDSLTFDIGAFPESRAVTIVTFLQYHFPGARLVYLANDDYRCQSLAILQDTN